MFQEKQLKDYSHNLSITLKREKDDLLSSWQISNLLSQISSQYYKNELLNTISLALNEGIQPENLFILNDSFNINNAYLKLDILDLNKSDDIKTFYHLGKPISLFPNERLFKTALMFDCFRKVNELLSNKKISPINKDSLLDLASDIHANNNLLRILDSISKLADNCLKKETPDRDEIVKNIKKLITNAKKEFEQYEKHKVTLDVMIDDIKNKTYKPLEDKKHKELETEYLNAFFTKFHNLKRPIVGIFYPNNNKIQILCTNFINKKKRDERFLDIKTISHNSPYLIDFIIGTSIALPLIKVLSLIKEQKKLNKREKELDLVESKTDQELNLIIQQLTSLSETAENKAYQEIDLPYLKDRISESQNQNNEKFKAPLKHYGFANRKIDITVQATTKSTSVGSKSV
ncbi:hypothetical protein CON66_27285 [Bacillus cereus]|uniref:hypothetical protein n=2 Tax=Bacillus cereus group TaxID=86661 RepID=UPI000BEDB069|nr:hypothetical protein [Bacillus cereus]PEA92935.1 hypothetical protein CON66_27285 [Bacillus cereus]PED37380.1 hypothetical protein CON24_14285 [Bacillus cereus]